MGRTDDIPVVFSGGVLRAEKPLDLPENSRLRIAIRWVEVTPEDEARGRELIEDLRRRRVIRLGGPLPKRQELYRYG